MPEIDGEFYREVRCQNCHKLLGYEYIFAGRLLFICPRCGELQKSKYKHLQNRENTDTIKREFSVGSTQPIRSEILEKKGGE